MKHAIGAVFLFFLSAFPAASWEIRTAFGPASYQFEGAGPSPTLLWESKPTYGRLPYAEIEFLLNARGTPLYRRLELEYLAGKEVREQPQAVVRKPQTGVLYYGWGWLTPSNFGFEAGFISAYQEHLLRDPENTAQVRRSTFRAGTYFGAFYTGRLGPLDWKISSRVGVLGIPQRQSAISELEAETDYWFKDKKWAIGFKFKAGLIQLVREASIIENLGTTPNAVTLFRQGETDTKIAMIQVRRRI